MSVVGKKILIVDDELWLISPIVELLEHCGVKVDTAQTIAGGINKNNKTMYDLLILDNMLPIGKLCDKVLYDYFKNSDGYESGMSFLIALKNPELKKLLNIHNEQKIIFHSISELSQSGKIMFEEMGIKYFHKGTEYGLEQLIINILNEKEASR